MSLDPFKPAEGLEVLGLEPDPQDEQPMIHPTAPKPRSKAKAKAKAKPEPEPEPEEEEQIDPNSPRGIWGRFLRGEWPVFCKKAHLLAALDSDELEDDQKTELRHAERDLDIYCEDR